MIKYCSDDDHKMNETRKSKHFSDFNNSRLIDWFTTNRELQKDFFSASNNDSCWLIVLVSCTQLSKRTSRLSEQ